MSKRIAVLGSTGSIGTQALEVIRENPEQFKVEVLTAQSNIKLLIKQALEFKPNAVVIGKPALFDKVSESLSPHDIKVFVGEESLTQIVEMESIDIVLIALVGFAGLKPTLNAIQHKKQIAIANKETFVVAGEIVTREAARNKVPVIPVDSEHSAIFQCLAGEHYNPIEKIYLTASGGPFFGRTKDELAGAKSAEALKHPNWDMGCKISIDSATMMNKGLEVIEAKWLFNLRPDQIDIIVHQQSIVHSMVQFEDGSIKAQMGLPDMKLPIQYAFTYPERLGNRFKRFNFADYPVLSFKEPDTETFRGISLAYEALNKGGNMPCILNAANEIAVDAYLREQIGFLEIYSLIEQSMLKVDFIKNPELDDYIETDKETRKKARDMINALKPNKI